MSLEEELAYRQGRVDQAAWIVNRLTEYLHTHHWLLEQVPMEFRDFLADLINDNVQEATHGTRPGVPTKIGA